MSHTKLTLTLSLTLTLDRFARIIGLSNDPSINTLKLTLTLTLTLNLPPLSNPNPEAADP